MTLSGVKKDVIITGATGFIGQHLVPTLLKYGYRVLAIARDEKKAATFEWFNNVEFMPLDINKGAPNLEIDPSIKVIHLAWQGLPNYKSEFHFEHNLPSNYRFLKSLVEKGARHIFVTGTCFEYGNQNGPIKSSAVCLPNTPYGYAKDALHKQLRFLQSDQSFTLQWGRLFYMFGRGQGEASILSQLDQAIDNGKSFFNMSGGEQLRDYLSVEAVVEQIFDIFEKGVDGIYNICSGKPIAIRNLVEAHIMRRNSNIKLNLGYYPYQDYEPMAFWGVKDGIR